MFNKPTEKARINDPDPMSDIYISEGERFNKDFASCEYQKRCKDHEKKKERYQTLQNIFKANAMDPAFQVDQGVATWNAGHSLFNTGDFWFVNASDRWNKTLWGTEENTKKSEWARGSKAEYNKGN